MSLGAALQTAPADPGRADDELERLLREADAALYAEKRARR
jgi:GGDEF domain-containing protein